LRGEQPWLVRYRVDNALDWPRPEPGNSRPELGATAGGLADGRQRGIARFGSPAASPPRPKVGCGRTWERRSRDRDGQETARMRSNLLETRPGVHLIAAALLGGCLCCLCIAVCSARGELWWWRELVDPDNPRSPPFPSFGVTPPLSTVFCLLARPFGACRPLPAEGPPNVSALVVQGGAKGASHPQQRPHYDRAVESVRWSPEGSRF
jgi:hypothetical protein